MTTRIHTYTSLALGGAIYAVTGSWPGAISALIAGVFIDIDHVFDFLMFSNERLTVDNFTSWCNEMKWKRITLVFHSYELWSLSAVMAYYGDSHVARGVVCGAVFHILLDQVGNLGKYKLSPWFYFLTFRLANGFKKDNVRK